MIIKNHLMKKKKKKKRMIMKIKDIVQYSYQEKKKYLQIISKKVLKEKCQFRKEIKLKT